jgi:glycosyltransferase involved in cell wall biosynthesis
MDIRVKKVSVIIPTYNRSTALSITLPTYFKDGVGEVIVVNDGSKDDTGKILEKYFPKFNNIPLIVVEHKSRLGQQKSRKTGIEKARFDYILFGEDDVYLHISYVNKLLEEVNYYNADIIAGRIIQINNFRSSLIKNIDDLFKMQYRYESEAELLIDPVLLHGKFYLSPAKPLEVPFVHTVALIRKSLFSYVTFDEWYKGNGYREETDFYLSAKKYGAKIMFTPNAVCLHLFGDINRAGGQRINIISREFYAIVNTYHLYKKHYNIISKELGLKSNIYRSLFKYIVKRWSLLFCKS